MKQNRFKTNYNQKTDFVSCNVCRFDQFPAQFYYLDLLDVVDDEHVLQVLHRSLHPVVEGCCSLGVFQVKLIYRLQLLLCPLLDR